MLKSAVAGACPSAVVVAAADAKEYPIGQGQTVAGIKAAKENPNGFARGDWIPYLAVSFVLTKDGDPEPIKGVMMPMVASDGSHYGDSVKLKSPGKYKLKLTVMPPSENSHAHFGRHVEKETGVGPWFKTCSVEYDFTYAGTGKKGAY